ncbi:hypothetical protein KSF_106400 [Reticulibacter mediterranei]|uniref:Glycosyl hydrolase n=1 Tax=Reticulibacter mediterranei TaxID=2778369 RepID=A0A8J3NAP3_9CHLR|nr:hypothetical protein [Reticulibacter mediterranei]GHP00593.1 hypothetical protein KSF_106400 [Reticulibacter mediterranei]
MRWQRNVLVCGVLLLLVCVSVWGVFRLHPFGALWSVGAVPVAERMNLSDSAMVSPEEGWAVGVVAGQPNYVLLHYQHGQWRRELPFGEGTRELPELGVRLASVAMTSASEGWAIGAGFLPTASPTPTTSGIEQNGTLGTVLLRYHQGWWSVFKQWATDPEFTRIAMHGPQQGWLLGSNGAETTLLRYDGDQWRPLALPQRIRTSAFHTLVPDGDKGIWLAGTTLAHYDGTVWRQTALPVNPSSPIVLFGLSMISPDEGWAVGSVSNSAQGVILHYQRGRLDMQSTASTPVLTNVTMRSASSGWAVGARGAILAYHHGIWTPVASPSGQALQHVALAPHSDDAWAVGDTGTILRYHEGQWTPSLIEEDG